MELNWKEIELSDRELITSYYRQENSRNCEATFANNYLWAPHYDMQYAIVEGMLVFLVRKGEVSVSFPLGTGDLRQVTDRLQGYFAEQGWTFRMHLVSPVQFGRLEALYPGCFQVAYDRDLADYVYESEKLISLAGKKLHSKRNHINKFKEQYPDWRYESITDDNTGECLKMAQEWRVLNGCDEDEEKSAEFCVTLNALRLRGELGLKGGLLRADGRVMGFTLGEPGGDDVFIVHIEKAYADVQGAYPMINQQFAEHEAAAYLYINREEDTGAEGLRKAKLSYRPVKKEEKGIVTLR